MSYNNVITFTMIVFGVMVGSFANVIIYRYPEIIWYGKGKSEGMSLSCPNSRCPKCNTELKWYHNIPVLSWLALRAKCAFCKVKIPSRYPLVELLMAVTYGVIAYLMYGTIVNAVIFAIFANVIIIGCFIYYDHNRLMKIFWVSLPVFIFLFAISSSYFGYYVALID